MNYTMTGGFSISGIALFSMTDWFYLGSGDISILGCRALVRVLDCYFVPFAPGSIVYSKRKALKGVLRKIYIKKILLNKSKNTGWQKGVYGDKLIMYLDSYNEVFDQKELIPLRDAIDLALNYWQGKLGQIDDQLAYELCNGS